MLISGILHIIVIISPKGSSGRNQDFVSGSSLSIGVYLVSLVNDIGDCNRNFQAASSVKRVFEF